MSDNRIQAHKIIHSAAVAAAVVKGSDLIPSSSASDVIGVQAEMIVSLASLHGISISNGYSFSLIGALSAAKFGDTIESVLTKGGSAWISAVTAFAVTEAIGWAANHAFESGQVPSGHEVPNPHLEIPPSLRALTPRQTGLELLAIYKEKERDRERFTQEAVQSVATADSLLHRGAIDFDERERRGKVAAQRILIAKRSCDIVTDAIMRIAKRHGFGEPNHEASFQFIDFIREQPVWANLSSNLDPQTRLYAEFCSIVINEFEVFILSWPDDAMIEPDDPADWWKAG